MTGGQALKRPGGRETRERTVVVSAKAAARWAAGHPWIYRTDLGRHEGIDAGLVRIVDPQGKGLGTVLFTALLAAARDRGIRRFRADVLADNRRMLDLIVRFTRVESRETRDAITSLVFTQEA